MKLLPEQVRYIILHSSHDINPKPSWGVDYLDRKHRMEGIFTHIPHGHHCGHHFVIRLDGTVDAARTLDMTGVHTYGHNEESVSVCYIGGRSADKPWQERDTRTPEQKKAMRELVRELEERFPEARTVTHNMLRKFRETKGCPGFHIDQL